MSTSPRRRVVLIQPLSSVLDSNGVLGSQVPSRSRRLGSFRALLPFLGSSNRSDLRVERLVSLQPRGMFLVTDSPDEVELGVDLVVGGLEGERLAGEADVRNQLGSLDLRFELKGDVGLLEHLREVLDGLKSDGDVEDEVGELVGEGDSKSSSFESDGDGGDASNGKIDRNSNLAKPSELLPKCWRVLRLRSLTKTRDESVDALDRDDLGSFRRREDVEVSSSDEEVLSEREVEVEMNG